MKKLSKILVVGYGSIGKRYIENISLNSKIKIIVNTSRKEDKFLNQKKCQIYKSIEDCIKEKPDVAIICNPTDKHVKISKISLKKIRLKKIYWIITKKNPFKKKPFFSLKERISKSKKAVKKYKKIKVLYLDDKIKSSRTINVINYFRKTKKYGDLYLILGSDSLLNFHKWTSWKKIVKLTRLVVFSRKGYDKKSKESIVVKYLNKKNIIYINNKLINISSSNIRKNNLNNF